MNSDEARAVAARNAGAPVLASAYDRLARGGVVVPFAPRPEPDVRPCDVERDDG